VEFFSEFGILPESVVLEKKHRGGLTGFGIVLFENE